MKTFNRRRKLQLDASYHVVCKINRDEIIFNDPVADLLLKTIARCKEKFSFRIHNFCIMGNHVHFMITPDKDASLPKIMQWINSVFAKEYNKLTGQSGHVWKERYFSRIIETIQQFITTFEYIVRNPLEAKLVEEAKDYRHSGLYYHWHKLESIVTEESETRELFERCKDFHQ